jgi:hypothetical protein
MEKTVATRLQLSLELRTELEIRISQFETKFQQAQEVGCPELVTAPRSVLENIRGQYLKGRQDECEKALGKFNKTHSKLQFESMAELRQHCPPDISKKFFGGKVLDLCSGPGDMATSIASLVGKGGQLIAVEFCPKIVETLEKRMEQESTCWQSSGVPINMKVLNIPAYLIATDPEAEDSGLLPETVDVVTIFRGLNRMPDKEKHLVMQAAQTLLKVDEALVIEEMFTDNMPKGRKQKPQTW